LEEDLRKAGPSSRIDLHRTQFNGIKNDFEDEEDAGNESEISISSISTSSDKGKRNIPASVLAGPAGNRLFNGSTNKRHQKALESMAAGLAGSPLTRGPSTDLQDTQGKAGKPANSTYSPFEVSQHCGWYS
jgi:hypothetical protein